MAQPIGGGGPRASSDDEDEDELDLKVIQSFADKIQRTGDRPHISIPKRGEKDFEPLAETVNLQEMMLEKSREALFGALQGVRGGASKSISHAVLTPRSPYPYLVVARGHLLDTLGITVREAEPEVESERDGGQSVKIAGKSKGKGRAKTQLLPEEALFMLERGSLQIWTAERDVWDDELCGVPGGVEMSVAEGFGAFLGGDLTWERYQASRAYAVLKRLGYTVQRTRRFIPAYFVAAVDSQPFRTWWTRLPNWISGIVRRVWSALSRIRFGAGIVRGTIASWRGTTYASLFAHLRITPTGHAAPLPRRSEPNPYTPFFHVWKPAYPWTKQKWDKGSAAGLLEQPANFHVAAINARLTPLPTVNQLAEIYDDLPDEPQGPPRRHGPQYRQPDPNRPWRPNPMAELRNGDRALVVAVNDSGNTGWVRFGRTGFAERAVI